MSEKHFLEKLQKGGKIISSKDCSIIEINNAQIKNNIFINEDTGNGFIYIPDGEDLFDSLKDKIISAYQFKKHDETISGKKYSPDEIRINLKKTTPLGIYFARNIITEIQNNIINSGYKYTNIMLFNIIYKANEKADVILNEYPLIKYFIDVDQCFKFIEVTIKKEILNNKNEYINENNFFFNFLILKDILNNKDQYYYNEFSINAKRLLSHIEKYKNVKK